jgi:hypothetical protein
MALSISADISATQQLLPITDPGSPVRGQLYRIEDEVVEYKGDANGDTAVWLVNRGVHGTTAATHTSTTTLAAVSLAVAIDEPS